MQSMDEFVLALMHHPPLRTQMRLDDKLLAIQVLMLLVCEVVVVILTTDRVIVGVDLDVL